MSEALLTISSFKLTVRPTLITHREMPLTQRRSAYRTQAGV